jgi:exopolysaccharide biosynthesis polyprenyl glycosylphosphotransferase
MRQGAARCRTARCDEGRRLTPPADVRALQGTFRTTSDHGAAARRGRVSLLSGDVVPLFDLWALLLLMWVSRFLMHTLDPAVALFGVGSFVLVVSPRAQSDRLTVSVLNDIGTLVRRVWLAYAFASAVSLLVGLGDQHALLAVSLPAAPLFIAGRSLSHAAERSFRRRGTKSSTLVVGAGDIARRLITTLNDHPEYGLRVVGAVDDGPRFSEQELGAPLLGGLPLVPRLVRANDVDVVIVAFSAAKQEGTLDVIRTAMASGARVWVIPRFFELGYATGEGVDHLWGLPVVKLQPPARSRPEWLLKRAMDFTLSAVALVASAPLMALIALVTYVDSGRPIFFRQVRVGLDARLFKMLKFRTMTPRDDERFDVRANHLEVTRVGRALRSTGLDELPQLVNVLRGEMSLVGPRPERPYFVRKFGELFPNYDARHRLPAGITGWAQVHDLRGELTDGLIEQRAVFDNFYIENWSLAQDIKILLRTVTTFFRGDEGGDQSDDN